MQMVAQMIAITLIIIINGIHTKRKVQQRKGRGFKKS
jgi:hypothetical protein